MSDGRILASISAEKVKIDGIRGPESQELSWSTFVEDNKRQLNHKIHLLRSISPIFSAADTSICCQEDEYQSRTTAHRLKDCLHSLCSCLQPSCIAAAVRPSHPFHIGNCTCESNEDSTAVVIASFVKACSIDEDQELFEQKTYASSWKILPMLNL